MILNCLYIIKFHVKMNNKGLKNINCELCYTSMRLCSKGLICKRIMLLKRRVKII